MTFPSARILFDTVQINLNKAGFMSHEIDSTENGIPRFAYSTGGGIPWHNLGVPLQGLSTVQDILKAASADFDVMLTRVAAIDSTGAFITNPDGSPVIIEDSRATVRANPNGTFDGLSTVGTRYVVKQNIEVAERALAVVGASNGDAVVDTAGVLQGGKRFFMTIDLGSLIVDPGGVADKIARYLVVSTGHDGIWPVRYANTDIRAVCQNTVRLGLENASSVFVARHTKNIDTAIEDAREVLSISSQWSREFAQMAELMLGIDVPSSSSRIDKVINSVFPKKSVESERQTRNREKQNAVLRAIFENSKNAGSYGHNGWSLYNAIVEYMDHHRDSDIQERASASMDDTSWVTKVKLRTQQAVLNLV